MSSANHPMTRFAGLLVAAAAGLTLLVLGSRVVFRSATRPTPPRIVAETTHITVGPQEGPTRPKVLIRVMNRGGSDLTIKSISTTCGCTVAAVDPKVVRPGATGVITVEATPPPAGERTVFLRVDSNAEPPNPLVITLKLLGSGRLPYVTNSTGPVQLGDIGTEVDEVVAIETRESSSSPPWFQEVATTSDLVLLEGGLENEVPSPDGDCLRQYRYKFRLRALPAPGPFSAELTLFNSIEGKELGHRLVVRGNRPAPVYSSPTRLFANVGPSRGRVVLPVTIATSPPDADLKVTCDPESVPSCLSIQPLARGDGRQAFFVTVMGPIDQDFHDAIVFEVNRTDFPRISVPIVLIVRKD